MLTAKGGDVDRVVGLEMGADDYIAKPYYPRELVARLRAVLRRQREAERLRRPKSRAAGIAARQARSALERQASFELTTSEFDMLECLIRAGEMVTTKEDLSLNVLGRPREIYDRSVDVHVSNLRKKLAAASSSELEIETIRGIGYRLRRGQ